MRQSRDLVAILVLLGAFIVGGLLLGGRGTTPQRMSIREDAPDPSYTNDRASGSRGAFEWAEKLGYTPVAWRQSWRRLPAREPGVLLVIDPRVQEPVVSLSGGMNANNTDRTLLSARDALTLRHWLKSGSGHTAILLSSRLPSGQSGSNASADDQATFADAFDLIIESNPLPSGRTEFAPLQPIADTSGILSVHSDSDMRIKRTRGDGLALFGDDSGPLAMEIPVGRGQLIVVADGALFSNANLPRSENALLLANLLAHYEQPGGRVLFDEYHHGNIADNGGSIWEALGRPLQLALIQLCLAALALFALLAFRFGPPVPLVRDLARSSSDYVASLASLYRRAEASGTALDTLYRQFLRDICGRLSLPPDVNLERLADVAARRGQVDKERLRRLLATCEMRLDAGKVSESELLELTRQMESIRKEIGIA